MRDCSAMKDDTMLWCPTLAGVDLKTVKNGDGSVVCSVFTCAVEGGIKTKTLVPMADRIHEPAKIGRGIRRPRDVR